MRLPRPAADHAAEEPGKHIVQPQTTRRRSFTTPRTTRLAGARQESDVVAGRWNFDFKTEYRWLPFGRAKQAHPDDLHVYR